MYSTAGENGLRIVTQLINNIQETEEMLKDFTEVTMTAFQKKPKATQCSSHHAINLNTHTAKLVERILKRGNETKIEDALGEDQF
jgi:ppGpp synthetase/RelA/SpoT-type nucleotidyltranferase